MGWTVLNLGRGVLASAITSVATTMEVKFQSEADVAGISGLSASNPMPLAIDPREVQGRDPEIVYAIADNTGVGLTRSFTVIRARERTTSPSNGWGANTPVGMISTAAMWDDALAVTTLPTPGLTTEQVQDTVGAMILGGANILPAYNDTAGTLTLAVTGMFTLVRSMLVASGTVTITPDTTNQTLTISAAAGDGGGGLSAEEVRDLIGSTLREGNGINIAVDDAADTVTLSAQTSSVTPRTDEEIRDVVVALLQAGANVTLTEDDTNDTLTIAASGGGGGSGGGYATIALGTWQRAATVAATKIRFNSDYTTVDISDTDVANTNYSGTLNGLAAGSVLFMTAAGKTVGFVLSANASNQVGFTRLSGAVMSGTAGDLPADGENIVCSYGTSGLIQGHQLQNDAITQIQLAPAVLELYEPVTDGAVVGDYDLDPHAHKLFIGADEPNSTDNTLVAGDLWIRT